MQIIRSRDYLGNPMRISAQIDNSWVRRMKALANPQPTDQHEDPQRKQPLDASDLAWVEKMLALAEDAPEEQEHEEPKEQSSDEALIHDFIHNKGIFA